MSNRIDMYCKGGIVMADAKLYSVQDIEILKQKIATYRDTLTTLKSGNAIDDYLFMKSELTGFKKQVSHLEEVIERLNDKRSMQIEEYELQIETFSQQMGSLNQTVEELNKDLTVVMDQLTDDRAESMDTPVDMLESVDANHNVDEVDSIEETTRLEDRTALSSIQQPNRPPSYNYLQNLIEKANDIQEVPSTVTPTASIHQTPGKPSFPSTGSHPNQIYNGSNRNINMKSNIHFNNISTKQVTTTRRSDNLVPSISQPTTKQEKNEVVKVSPEEVHQIATIEEEVNHIREIEEVNHIEKIEEEVHQIEKVEREMNPVAVIEIPIEMKRQQHKNKETLSLFSFFSRKS